VGINLAEYRTRASEAVRMFWEHRHTAQRQQADKGRMDRGERASVTAGKNMDGFIHLMTELVHVNGLNHAEIYTNRSLLSLPGYFRPTKMWDLLVIHRKRLVAAIECKSQVGPSFGNNFNNRTEEAIGTALDLWTTYREGRFGDAPRPFVGWLMLIEDCDASRSRIRDSSPHFPTFPEFNNASYAERYDLLCRKLVHEQLYTAATVLLSPRSAIDTGSYSSLSMMTGLETFVTTFAGHIAAEAARET